MDPQKVHEVLPTVCFPQFPKFVILASQATFSYAYNLLQLYGNGVLPQSVASEALAARRKAQDKLRKWRPTARVSNPTERRQELEYYGNQIILEQFLRGVLSSIRVFPPELLSLIFVYACVGSDDLGMRFFLTRVCRRWRQVAFETSLLWTRLEIDLVQWGPTGPKVFGVSDLPAYVRECIRRAKNRPIIFQWREKYVDLGRVDCNWMQTFGPFLEKIPYRSFTWITPSHCRSEFSSLFDPALVHLRAKSQNSLERLSLSNYDETYSTSLPEMYPAGWAIDLTVFRELSKLKLSLSSSFFSENLKFRESFITVLDIETGVSMWQLDILNLLKRCTNLESCKLKSLHFTRDTGYNPSVVAPRVRLPKLHTLHLACKIHMMFLGLLTTMETPSLERLTIHLKCDSRLIAFEEFLPFFTQCTNLQYLWISGISSKQDLVDVLSPTVPRLKELGIMVNGEFLHSSSRSKSVYDALDALRVRPGRPVLFPNLAVLHVICHADQRIIHSFCEIVTSRRWHQSRRSLRPCAHLTITNEYTLTRHSLPRNLPITVAQELSSRVDPIDFSSFIMNGLNLGSNGFSF